MKFSPLLLAVMGMAPSIVFAQNVITFAGTITGRTCEVNIAGQPSPTVDLPTVDTSLFDDAGSTAGLRTFTLDITNCPIATVERDVTPHFNPTAATDGNLDNVATDNAARNVAVQLTTDANGQSAIYLQGDTRLNGLPLPPNQTGISHTFGVQYIAVGGNPTAGSVLASVGYSITYL